MVLTPHKWATRPASTADATSADWFHAKWWMELQCLLRSACTYRQWRSPLLCMQQTQQYIIPSYPHLNFSAFFFVKKKGGGGRGRMNSVPFSSPSRLLNHLTEVHDNWCRHYANEEQNIAIYLNISWTEIIWLTREVLQLAVEFIQSIRRKSIAMGKTPEQRLC
jgi:hypothetical protein